MFIGIIYALIAGLMWGLVFVSPLLLPEYPPALQSVGAQEPLSQPARAMHAHMLPRDLEQGGFKRALNGWRGLWLFLYLPAAVARAHVGDE